MQAMVEELHEIITREGSGEGSLVATLEAIQDTYHYLPRQALILASEQLNIPLSRVYAVATFYNAFTLAPKGKHCLHVCMGTACHVRGSPHVLDRMEIKLGIQPGETTPDRLFTLETVNCLGACALGPIVVTDDEYAGQMTPQKVDILVRHLVRAEAKS
jgi:NADH-quinone oxidoreductase subunit E